MNVRRLYDGPGVYFIKSVSGKWYVGSSVTSVRYRVGSHLTMLRAGRHYNRYLQNAWDKHGPQGFQIGTLERCEPQNCLAVEQKWIDCLKAADRQHGYNLCPQAKSRLGMKVSEESRLRISRSQMGKKLSAEHKAKVAAGNKGKVMTPEQRKKLSLAMRGNKNGLGHRYTVTEETRKKLIDDLTGRRYGMLTVLYFHSTAPHAKWVCRCDCGNTTVTFGNSIKRGITKSCGCLCGRPYKGEIHS